MTPRGPSRVRPVCLALPEAHEVGVTDRLFVPPYVGPSGWVGVWLDAKTEWDEAEYYRSWLVRHPAPRAGVPLRGLDTAHFDFRGGVPRDEPWIPGRSPDDRHASA
jgi:hypothetical protein